MQRLHHLQGNNGVGDELFFSRHKQSRNRASYCQSTLNRTAIAGLSRKMFFQKNVGEHNHLRNILAITPRKDKWRKTRRTLPLEIDQMIIWEVLSNAVTPRIDIIDQDPLGPIAPLRAASGGQLPTRIDRTTPSRTLQFSEVPKDQLARMSKCYREELRPALDRVAPCSKVRFVKTLTAISTGFLCIADLDTMLWPLRRLRGLLEQQLAEYKPVCNALEEKVMIHPRRSDDQQLPYEATIVGCRHPANVLCLTRRYSLGLWKLPRTDAHVAYVASCALPTYLALYNQISFLEAAKTEVNTVIKDTEACFVDEEDC